MAERVWADVMVDDLYDGDTVEGYGLVLYIWTYDEERDYNGACMDDQCCGVTFKVLSYGVRFEDGTTEIWKFSKPVRALVDPDWTVFRNEDAWQED